jgi:hypothetical protein
MECEVKDSLFQSCFSPLTLPNKDHLPYEFAVIIITSLSVKFNTRIGTRMSTMTESYDLETLTAETAGLLRREREEETTSEPEPTELDRWWLLVVAPPACVKVVQSP